MYVVLVCEGHASVRSGLSLVAFTLIFPVPKQAPQQAPQQQQGQRSVLLYHNKTTLFFRFFQRLLSFP